MKALALALGVPLLLAVGQQQLLLQQRPRLISLKQAAASSGPAALQLRFSRPMDRTSLAANSSLSPALPARWLGSGSSLVLSLEPGSTITGPLALSVAGLDRRGTALAPQRWQWDPRSRILAVVPVAGGEQLQLQRRNGSWQPISPIWARIVSMEPLGDGSGVAVVSQDPLGSGPASQRVWRIPLQGQQLAPAGRPLDTVLAGPPQAVGPRPVLFAHLSSNRRGDLLVQTGDGEPGQSHTLYWPRGEGRRQLPWAASGPMRLLPQGGAVVVPGSDGLSLQTLPPRPPRQQTLPGSRDLSSFCPRADRALLSRHWPDYRRSLELVEPGQAPRQVWIGSQALMASSCKGSGERIWLALVEGVQRPRLTLLKLDRRGQVLGRNQLDNWELEPGSGMAYDPSRNMLLLVLRPRGAAGQPPPPSQLVLVEAESLQLRPLGKNALQAAWLG
jgi:hypothetical protein